MAAGLRGARALLPVTPEHSLVLAQTLLLLAQETSALAHPHSLAILALVRVQQLVHLLAPTAPAPLALPRASTVLHRQGQERKQRPRPLFLL